MIRTNLYERGLMERTEYRARWPFVCAGAALLLIAAAFGHWFALSGEVARLRNEATRLQASVTQTSATLAAEREHAETESLHKARREQVLHLARSRFSWGPMLERLFGAFPENVEISSVKGSSFWTGGTSHLVITGIAAGEVPRLEADKFRLRLLATLQQVAPRASADYMRLEDSSRQIQMGNRAYSVAEFTIALHWSNSSDVQ